MNLRLLKIFQTVCRTESISRAAAELYISQPAVSQAMKELEAESGLVLFDRLSRKLKITEYGKLYLDRVNYLLDACQEFQEFTEDLGRQSILRLGSCITIACHWLPRAIRQFQQAVPTALIQTTIASAAGVLELLAAGQIDLALYEGIHPGPPYRALPFSRYRLIPVCAPSHPLAGQSQVSIPALLRESLLLREPGSTVRDTFDSFLRLRGTKAAPVMSSTNSQALMAAAGAGLGISILPDIIVSKSLKDGLLSSFLVKDMDLFNEAMILIHQDKKETKAIREFTACLLL